MLFYLISQIVTTFAALLYPCFMTFKTMAQRPGYEDQYPRWMMYWSIMALIIAFEYTFEWLVSWVWFYHECKTLFLIFLILPQTQGSTYIYQQFVLPLVLENEALLDEYLAAFQSQFFSFIQTQFRRVWELVFGAASSFAGQNLAAGQSTEGDAAGGPAKMAQNLWAQYGPNVVATGASLLRPQPQQTPSSSSSISSRSMDRPQNGSFQRPRPGGGDFSRSSPNVPTSKSSLGPSFPIPQVYPPAFVPSMRHAASDLPAHPAPFYTEGYSTVKGE